MFFSIFSAPGSGEYWPLQSVLLSVIIEHKNNEEKSLEIWAGGYAMERWTMAVPCLFGLEGLVGDELRRMGMEDVRVEDRRVFTGGAAELARANIGLRMGRGS